MVHRELKPTQFNCTYTSVFNNSCDADLLSLRQVFSCCFQSCRNFLNPKYISDLGFVYGLILFVFSSIYCAAKLCSKKKAYIVRYVWRQNQKFVGKLSAKKQMYYVAFLDLKRNLPKESIHLLKFIIMKVLACSICRENLWSGIRDPLQRRLHHGVTHQLWLLRWGKNFWFHHNPNLNIWPRF